MNILDCHPAPDDMLGEVSAGLQQSPKTLPSKYFYDQEGARLFEAICELPEYYPTRTELAILDQAMPLLAEALGPGRWVLEPGSGSGIKTEILLAGLDQAAAYVPIDISKAQLKAYGQRLHAQFPEIDILPVCADFTAELSLPAERGDSLIWFPGSTIGNFHRPQAQAFLQRMSRWGRPEQKLDLLIGVDLRKDIDVLEAAYNDAAGVTAEFNRNLLHHLNRTLDCGFEVELFRHEARWNADKGAIQMLLHCEQSHRIRLGEEQLQIRDGEVLCTEHSYKYSPEEFLSLAAAAGWQEQGRYLDDRAWFGLFHLQAESGNTQAAPAGQ